MEYRVCLHCGNVKRIAYCWNCKWETKDRRVVESSHPTIDVINLNNIATYSRERMDNKDFMELYMAASRLYHTLESERKERRIAMVMD